MLTADCQKWLDATKEEILDNAKQWSKTYTTKRLEVFVDWYRSLIAGIYKGLSEDELKGLETDKTKEIDSLKKMESCALIARFIREFPGDEIPEFLYQ